MISFFQDMAENPLLASGLVAGILASVACGVIGPYVVAKRIVFLSGGMAHVTVGGVGAAIFLAYWAPASFGWLSPLAGALIVALLSALLIAVVNQRVGERTDTLIGAIWAIGMAGGILLVRFTPGYHAELLSYLFGNLALVGWGDVGRLAALDAVLLVAVGLLHKRLVALCLDEEWAQLQGVNVLWGNALLLGLVALAVVALMQVVGLILVIALLTLPAATAGHYAKTLGRMMGISTLLCLGLVVVPRAAVYGTRLAPESAIVLAAGVVYLASLGWKRVARWLVGATVKTERQADGSEAKQSAQLEMAKEAEGGEG